MKLKNAIEELRKEEKRKFEQTVDLIVKLKGINLKRDIISIVTTFPNKIRDKKIGAFLTTKSKIIDTITPPEFKKYQDVKELRNLINTYDFFIASASLMPQVASNFGKSLGPTGKMPTPQLGMITQESDNAIKEMVDKISNSIKLRAKEPSIKLAVAREGMKDEEIMENVKAMYKSIVNALPTKQENVKNVAIKFTMSKLIKVEDL